MAADGGVRLEERDEIDRLRDQGFSEERARAAAARQFGDRTNELGVRMALGAARGDILWMIVRETLGLMGIGPGAGLALSLAASRHARACWSD